MFYTPIFIQILLQTSQKLFHIKNTSNFKQILSCGKRSRVFLLYARSIIQKFTLCTIEYILMVGMLSETLEHVLCMFNRILEDSWYPIVYFPLSFLCKYKIVRNRHILALTRFYQLCTNLSLDFPEYKYYKVLLASWKLFRWAFLKTL